MLTVKNKHNRHYYCDCECGRKDVLVLAKTIKRNIYGCGNHLPLSYKFSTNEARILAWAIPEWRIKEKMIYSLVRRQLVVPYCRVHIADRVGIRMVDSFTSSRLLCYKVWVHDTGIKEPDLNDQWTSSPLLERGVRNTVFERIKGSTPDELEHELNQFRSRMQKMLIKRFGRVGFKIKQTIVADNNKWYGVLLIVLN